MSGSTRPVGLLVVLCLAALAGVGCSNSGHRPQGTSRPAAAQAAKVDWAAVEAIFERKADVTGDVHRFALPRSDLTVKLRDVTLKPGFALGSYAAFMPAGDRVMVMGDLVLTEAEVAPVLGKFQQGGFEMTALHNHLVGEQPKVMYMHYEGSDSDGVTLARKLRDVLAASATPLGPPAPSTASTDLGFDPAELDHILGHQGTVAGGLYKQSLARAEQVKMHVGSSGAAAGQSQEEEVVLNPAMGVATVINFQPLGGGRAAVTGDFALLASESAKVVQTLQARGIDVTALHTHLTDDEPTIYYLHFFATGEAKTLAEGLRTALDETHVARG